MLAVCCCCHQQVLETCLSLEEKFVDAVVFRGLTVFCEDGSGFGGDDMETGETRTGVFEKLEVRAWPWGTFIDVDKPWIVNGEGVIWIMTL